MKQICRAITLQLVHKEPDPGRIQKAELSCTLEGRVAVNIRQYTGLSKYHYNLEVCLSVNLGIHGTVMLPILEAPPACSPKNQQRVANLHVRSLESFALETSSLESLLVLLPYHSH